MKVFKKIVSVGLSLALCAGLVAPALAVEYDIANGSVYVENDDNGVYSYQGTKTDEGISRDTEIVVTGTTTENTIKVGDNVEATVTLKDANIDVSDTASSTSVGKAAFSIGAGSDVTVELDGDNTLKSGDGRAGLEVNGKDGENESSSVTIQDESGEEGTLSAEGGSYGAGIGGGYSDGPDGMWIKRNEIYGTMILDGADSGLYESTHSMVGDITITGGTVTATGGYESAGIGGGYKNSMAFYDKNGNIVGSPDGYSMFGDITITGGKVTATGGIGGGAGIGGGYGLSGSMIGDINISNAEVTATGNDWGTGIGAGAHEGCGDFAMDGDITIVDSTVTATGGGGAAGIGTSNNKSEGNITIINSILTATGGNGSKGHSANGYDLYSAAGAGIGSGGGSTGMWESGEVVFSDSAEWQGNVLIIGGNVSVTGGANQFDDTKAANIEVDGDIRAQLEAAQPTQTYVFQFKEIEGREGYEDHSYTVAVNGNSVAFVGDPDNLKGGEYFAIPAGCGVTEEGVGPRKCDFGGVIDLETGVYTPYNRLSFDPNGGELTGDSDTEFDILDGGTLPTEDEPGEPTRPGYEFNGWVVIDPETDEPMVDDNGDPVVYVPGETPVSDNMTLRADWTELPERIPGGGFDIGGTVIDDVEVPLAGLFTRADAIGYLWQQAGEPEAELSDFPDVDADHQWAVAIGWAQDMGIALPDLEGNFRPDDLVERFVEDEELKPEGELEEFLNRYAEYAGIELDEDELFYVLGGQADDIVMGEEAQVIFDDFFARLEAALAQAA